MEASLTFRHIAPTDLTQIKKILENSWGSVVVIIHGNIIQADQLDGFVAEMNNQLVGLVTYMIHDDSCEVITLDSLMHNRGIGGILLREVAKMAVEAGCRRLWLVTTNDNLEALRFYQHQGFRLCGLRPGAVENSRLVKPAIPLIAENGIPIRDEIDLEIEPLLLIELPGKEN